MARLFGMSAILLGAVAWPAFTQDAAPRIMRLRSAVLPNPTPTPDEVSSTVRTRRSVVTDTAEPEQRASSSVYIQRDREQRKPTAQNEAVEPRSVLVRTRRDPIEIMPDRRGREAGEAQPAAADPGPGPVRVRRYPAEITTEPVDRDRVRLRRVPRELTTVGTQRDPFEAEPTTDPEPRPAGVRRTRTDETPPAELDPVRVRQRYTRASEDEPAPDPTPVRVRRTPYSDSLPTTTPPELVYRTRYSDSQPPPPVDPTPVRTRRSRYSDDQPATFDPTPVRIRRVSADAGPTQTVTSAPTGGQFGATHSGTGCAYRPAQQQPAAFHAGNLPLNTQITIVPPPETAVTAQPGAVMLRPGSYADVMQTLPVLRQIPAAALHGQGKVTIGKTVFDFNPMIQNPKALTNIARQLRTVPDQVDVCADILEAMEVDRGLVVRSLLSYRIRLGGCATAERRKRLAATGVNCFTRTSPSEQIKGFSDPKSANYIENATKRAQAITAAHIQAGKMAADIAQNTADFRSQVEDPARRPQLVAEFGEAEVVRLAGLDDEALAGELANSSETAVEQVAFVPNTDTVGPTVKSMMAPTPSPGAKTEILASYDVGNYLFLTGFTLGKKYEWKQRIETTIKWCLVGCKKTYYAELFAGFTYGFGLRFPIQFGGTYNPQPDANGNARLKVRLAPVNGSVADYQSTGLAADKLYDGKELVAEFSVYAGGSAKLPLVGTLGPVDFSYGRDFTAGLPAPLANGQFTPPTPGHPETNPTIEKIFDDVDLIGGRANFGILGGQVFPAVQVTLNSNKMGLLLRDTGPGGKTVPLTTDGQDVKLAIDPVTQRSAFTVENPMYNLGFEITPGLDARLFINLAVWSNHWDWPVWFPQLAIKLPSEGKEFVCHLGTSCTHSFILKTKGIQSEFDAALEDWARDVDARWLPKCVDEPCRFGIGLIRQNTIFLGHHMEYDNPAVTIAAMKSQFGQAEIRAGAMVLDSKGRKAEAAGNSWGVIAQAIWSKQCNDIRCYDEVKALAAQMGPRGRDIAKANPDQSPLWVTQQVNKEFVPQFKQAVDASAVRIATEQSFELQRQLRKQKGIQPIK